jgi:hypothetical protein
MQPEFTFIKHREADASWNRVSWTADEFIRN